MHSTADTSNYLITCAKVNVIEITHLIILPPKDKFAGLILSGPGLTLFISEFKARFC